MKKIVQISLAIIISAYLAAPSHAFDLGSIGGLVSGDTVETIKTAAEIVSDTTPGPVDEYFLGREVSARLLGAYNIVPLDSKLTEYVKKVGSTVALNAYAPQNYKPYAFVVLDDNDINAFAAPGGFVFITTGMLKFVKSEDELAVILGHEIGHVDYQHGMTAVGSSKINKLIGLMSRIAKGQIAANSPEYSLFEKLFDSIMDKMLSTIQDGYSVEMESEADSRGLKLANAAGYNASAFLDVLERFKKKKNHYGGAGYPKERRKLAANVIDSMKIKSINKSSLATRDKRFKKSIVSLLK